MESFYGGRPGYGFVIRGVYSSRSNMENALGNTLQFGDYAIIGGSNTQIPDYGTLYRVNDKLELVKLGRITAPAMLMDLIPQNLNEQQGATSTQMRVEGSQPKLYTRAVSAGSGSANGQVHIGFSIPELNLEAATSHVLNGSAYNLEISNSNGQPYHKTIKLSYPPAVRIKDEAGARTPTTQFYTLVYREVEE